ncbi:hypothetical protein ACIGKQ_21050 [Gordonia sp. NPDC062954]|uniref:hypothetical protein n=1 Tax=Gordonia sp. NPDC062954 TaxID=3364003 RepID=UPI0037C81331
MQWSRARRMLAEASEDDARRDELIASAIDIATASWIACEHERFQFDDAARRRRWALIADRRLAATLSLAYEHGSAALVAELIDSGLNAGSHSADADFGDEDAGADPGGEKLSFWSTELWVDVSSDSRSVVTTDDAAGSQSSSHRSEAAARLLDNRELAMEPPAELRYPINSGTHRVVLGPQREMAAALDPDLRVIFTSVPTVEAW